MSRSGKSVHAVFLNERQEKTNNVDIKEIYISTMSSVHQLTKNVDGLSNQVQKLDIN